MVRDVPPIAGPEVGDTDVTTGEGTYVNAFVNVLFPPSAATYTPTAPAARAGATAVIDVAELTVKEVALVPVEPPNFTAVTHWKFVPVMVVDVPPPVAPVVVDNDVTVGAPAAV